jgi:uncharacterized RDD family membrane protein YckC
MTAAAAPLAAPGLARRMACFVYEGVLLFGVVMIAGLIYAAATQQRHALMGQTGLRVFLFVLIGAYFVTCWARSGQTLAMLTWRIRLVTSSGEPVSWMRGLARYLLSWLWFVPALVALWAAGLKAAWPAAAVIAVGIIAYAALAWLHPSRQFWHDLACGTRLIDLRVGSAQA